MSVKISFADFESAQIAHYYIIYLLRFNQMGREATAYLSYNFTLKNLKIALRFFLYKSGNCCVKIFIILFIQYLCPYTFLHLSAQVKK